MILVTGGTGLVGSHLLLKLSQEETPVRAIYRSIERIKVVEKLFAFAKAQSHFSKIQWIKADITHVPELATAFEGIHSVYHCAALISFNPYDFDLLIKTNVEGTANVVNLCLANSVTKLCHLSSIASLASLPNNPVDEENHWDPNEDNSVYAISKYGAETEVWRASQEGLDILIFNPGVILGEAPIKDGSGKLFERIKKGASYYPKGGTAFIDVKDLVAVMIYGMKSNVTNDRFVAISNNYSYKYVLDCIATHLNLNPPKKALSNTSLNLLRALDYCVGLFTRKRRLTKNMIKSVQTTKHYSNTKLATAFSYISTPIDSTLKRVSLYHK